MLFAGLAGTCMVALTLAIFLAIFSAGYRTDACPLQCDANGVPIDPDPLADSTASAFCPACKLKT
jgi:hypothetical protein